MLYGQRMRQIADHYTKQEEAIERLSFCYDVYEQFVTRGNSATEHMDAEKATRQLLEAVQHILRR
jgi:hypothetical protein